MKFHFNFKTILMYVNEVLTCHFNTFNWKFSYRFLMKYYRHLNQFEFWKKNSWNFNVNLFFNEISISWKWNEIWNEMKWNETYIKSKEINDMNKMRFFFSLNPNIRKFNNILLLFNSKFPFQCLTFITQHPYVTTSINNFVFLLTYFTYNA